MFDHLRHPPCGAHRHRHAWEGRERFGGGRHGHHEDGFGGRGRGRGGRFFEHGALRFVLLALLAEKPAHGYELIKAIEDKVGGAYSPSAGVVYPTLTLLEETGQIEVVSADGNKKLYGPTDAGRAAIDANRPMIDALFARMGEAGETRRGERDPRVVRAVESLKLALRLKLESGLDETRTTAVVALLDETVARLEAL